MNKSFSLLFTIKNNKKLANGTVPIYLRITLDSTRCEIATKRYVAPEKWNHTAQKATGNTEEVRSLNLYLKSLEQQVYNVHKELMELKTELTAQNLKTKLYGGFEKNFSLIDVFKEHNKQIAALVDKEYAPATLKRYGTDLRHVNSFLQWKYKVNDINIKKIDHAFITSFDFYLRSVRNCNNNSTFKYIKNFKKVIRICIANGWITKDPFAQFKIKIKEVEKEFLSTDELDLLSTKQFSVSRLAVTRDIFIFCCYQSLLSLM